MNEAAPPATPADADRRLANLLGAAAIGVSDRLVANFRALKISEGAGPAALAVIGHHPGASVLALSKILNLSHPGAVRLLDTLSARDLVRRERSLEDGRLVRLWLTPAGEAMRARLLGEREAELLGLLAGFSAKERALLAGLLERLVRSLPRDIAEGDRICRFCDESQCADCPIKAEQTGRLRAGARG